MQIYAVLSLFLFILMKSNYYVHHFSPLQRVVGAFDHHLNDNAVRPCLSREDVYVLNWEIFGFFRV